MPGRRFLIALGSVFCLVVLVRTAWLSELSYLTLRTIEHAATGHGLRWNISERVQVFDHPLWMLLLLAGRLVTGESYYTTFVISLVLSTAAAVMVLRSARRTEGIVLGVLMLSLSWALVTYSTSGLEGPLAHLLVAAFCVTWMRDGPGALHGKTMAALGGLAAVTHVSTLLVTGPALIAAMRRGIGGVGPTAGGPHTAARLETRGGGDTRRAEAGVSARDSIGARLIFVWAVAPLLAWALFATFYYGTPVPMPVIAEWTEHAGIGSRVEGASRLLAFVLRHDPITLAIIGTALVLGVRTGGSGRTLAWGAAAYCVVLALWAGDGMPGRWLALPCLVSSLIIVRHPLMERPRVALACAAAAGLAAVPASAPIRSDARFGTTAQFRGERDQRVPDYRATGLLLDIRQWYPPHHPEAARGGIAWRDTNRVKTSPHPGFFGFAAGYGVHVIDRTGRTDPLLSRLPPERTAAFPAGVERRVPEGYEASLPDSDNVLRDPALAAYYDRVRFVTRGRLVDSRRLLAALCLVLDEPPRLRSRLLNPAALRLANVDTAGLTSRVRQSPAADRAPPVLAREPSALGQ